MIDRYLKILFVAMVGAMAGLYVSQNWANFDAAVGAVGYIVSLEGHEVYPNNAFFALPQSLHTVAALTIFAGEMAAALFALWGSFRLFKARSAPAAEFEAAKSFAKIGCGLGVLVWWGMFQTIGGAWFQLWQSPQGEGPFYGSWIYGGICMMVLIYLSQRES